jgi:hypothetical protein
VVAGAKIDFSGKLVEFLYRLNIPCPTFVPMTAFLTLLRLRFRQLRRESADLGIVHWLVLLILSMLGIAQLSVWAGRYPDQWIVAAVLGSIPLGIQIRRRDRRLMAHIWADPRPFMTGEYLAFMMLFIVLFLSLDAFGPVLLLLLSCVAAGYWPFENNRRNTAFFPTLNRFIPADNFEWVAGIREKGLIVLGAYTAALALVFVPVASLILLWFILMIVGNFYRYGESRQMLVLYETTPLRFLRKKLRTHLALFTVPTLPVLALYFYFNPGNWLVPLGFLVVSTTALACILLSKYSAYAPNRELTSNDLVNGLVLLSVVVVFFFPVPFMACLWYYFRAKRNLGYWF